MAEKSKTPAIRFEGFTDDWEQRKLGDVLTEKKHSIELEDNNTYELVTVRRRNEGVISRGFLKGKEILVKNYFKVQAGDFIISKRQVIHGANGIVPQKLDKAIVSNEYLVVIGNENITTEFWTLISKLPSMYEMFFLSSYGIDIEKLVFDVEDWKKRAFFIPELTEQKRITKFFNSLSTLITLHQRKLLKLKNVKKAMLEKMFPKNGSNVPEIRFRGFTDAWEQREFSNIVHRVSTMNANDDLPRVEYEDIISDLGRLNKDLTKKESKKTGIEFSIGDVLFGKLRPYIKNWLLADFPGIAVGDFWVLRSDEIDSTYLYYLIQTPSFQVAVNQSTGTKMPRADWSLVSKSQFFFPIKREEQARIGATFHHLDNLITLHQCKLEKLKNIKKACLEKMFI